MKACQKTQTLNIKKSFNMYSRQLKSSQNFRINFIDENQYPSQSVNKSLIKKVASKKIMRHLRPQNINQQNNWKSANIENFFKKVQTAKQKYEQIKNKKNTQNNFYEKLFKTLSDKLKKNQNHSTQQAKQHMKLIQKCRINKHIRKNSLSCSFQKFISSRTSNSQSFNYPNSNGCKKNKLSLKKECCLQKSLALNKINQFYDENNSHQQFLSQKNNNILKQKKISSKNQNYFSQQRFKKNDNRYLSKKYFESQRNFRIKVNQLMNKCQKQNYDDNGIRKNLNTFKFFCDTVDKRLEFVENIFTKKYINI